LEQQIEEEQIMQSFKHHQLQTSPEFQAIQVEIQIKAKEMQAQL